ncbi:hypothetical protein THAOC_01048 [Thalassiosira oceanica]|uniref:Uncharacterized protein n=1 Tax=Thalassiosira oceanica TaxID=159749 RepID=K0TNH8_THAOC|nr:hypothetical protein THAOC_01048 [Thalassiosira oceanica]|eukprot:EJK77141.1 hypothetical protein THAOC_01048 [Thalassiosira oceanica]
MRDNSVSLYGEQVLFRLPIDRATLDVRTIGSGGQLLTLAPTNNPTASNRPTTSKIPTKIPTLREYPTLWPINYPTNKAEPTLRPTNYPTNKAVNVPNGPTKGGRCNYGFNVQCEPDFTAITTLQIKVVDTNGSQQEVYRARVVFYFGLGMEVRGPFFSAN